MHKYTASPQHHIYENITATVTQAVTCNNARFSTFSKEQKVKAKLKGLHEKIRKCR